MFNFSSYRSLPGGQSRGKVGDAAHDGVVSAHNNDAPRGTYTEAQLMLVSRLWNIYKLKFKPNQGRN